MQGQDAWHKMPKPTSTRKVTAGKICTQASRVERTPGGDSSVLDFLFLFHQGKRKGTGRMSVNKKCMVKEVSVCFSKPEVAE